MLNYISPPRQLIVFLVLGQFCCACQGEESSTIYIILIFEDVLIVEVISIFEVIFIFDFVLRIAGGEQVPPSPIRKHAMKRLKRQKKGGKNFNCLISCFKAVNADTISGQSETVQLPKNFHFYSTKIQ